MRRPERNSPIINRGDTIFEVEITSNRPDLLSYRGIAREIAAIGAGTLKPFALSAPNFPTAASTWTAQLGAPELGPYYTATHLTGVKVGPSPQWLQDAIESTGHRPINNVVDITNFVLFETGQPLHAFDAEKLSGHVIEVRRARAGERLEALDDKTYALLPDDLVIADAKGPVAIAGVMGGKPTGVTEATKEVVLEAAWFLQPRCGAPAADWGLFPIPLIAMNVGSIPVRCQLRGTARFPCSSN